MMPIVQAAAQVSPEQKQVFRAKGFTDADFKVFEVTQISPHFQFFSRWDKCSKAAVSVWLSNGRSAEAAVDMARSVCADEALQLRASIAPKLGLLQATRVINFLNAALTVSADQAWQRAHPAVDPNVRQVGRWFIRKNGPGACQATTDDNGHAGPLVLSINAGTMALVLQTTSQQPADGKTALGRVIIGHDPAPSQVAAPFEVMRYAERTWIVGHLTPQEVQWLRYTSAVTLKPSGSTSVWSQAGDETYSLDETAVQAIDALQRC